MVLKFVPKLLASFLKARRKNSMICWRAIQMSAHWDITNYLTLTINDLYHCLRSAAFKKNGLGEKGM